jgi:glycerophosphoryl diester phosphodiesterase family protein
VVSGPAPLRLRPLSLSELLDEVFRIYRAAFPLFIGIALAVSIPTLIVVLAFGVYTVLGGQVFNTPEFQRDPSTFFQSAAFGSLLAGAAVWALVTLFLIPFSYGAPVRAAIDVSLGRQPTFGSVAAATLRRYFALWGAAIVYALVILLLTITVIGIPVAIWIYVRWALFVPAMLTENVGPIRALGRSWQLVEGRWWRTCGILLLIVLLIYVVSLIGGAFFQFLGALIPGLSADARLGVNEVGSNLGSVLAVPIQYIAWTLMYFDLRVRKESFDLDQLAQQVQSTGPSPVG